MTRSSNTRLFKDQMDNAVAVNFPPKRIVSLVPSQTELLFDLGLHEQIIGITKFCVHPKNSVGAKVKIGGTKKLDIEKISALEPDLIIGNKEENEKEQVLELSKSFPVWMSDIKTLQDAYEMILSIGDLTSRKNEAAALKNEIEKKFNPLKKEIPVTTQLRTAYLIWYKPIMCAGTDTFINCMLETAGFKNVFEDKRSRYPEMTIESLKKLDPELILLSSEPFPFKEKHVKEFQHAFPEAIIKIVDGELFSWYGSRLLHTPAYLMNLNKTIKEAE